MCSGCGFAVPRHSLYVRRLFVLLVCLCVCAEVVASSPAYVVPVVTARIKDRVYSTTLALRNDADSDVVCEAIYAVPNDPKGGTLRKAEFLALVDRGPAAVQLDPSTQFYRVSVPEDPDGGVWLPLSSDGSFRLDKTTPVFVRVGGLEVRLTRAEASEMRGVVATAMRLRSKPWHGGSTSKPAPPVRAGSPARPNSQKTSGASNGGKIRSPVGSTAPDASENAA